MSKIERNPHEQELIDFLISQGFKNNSPYPFTKDEISVEFGCGYISKIFATADYGGDIGIRQDIIIDGFRISKVDELLHTFKYSYIDSFIFKTST